jgi:PHD/YefM family antitoxin component YafN of YafNO toxin-antitoxin module
MIEREPHLQYISDEKGNIEGVIVPIEVWREILSERETAYPLDSAAMKQRLLEAMQRTDGIPFEQALEKLGI